RKTWPPYSSGSILAHPNQWVRILRRREFTKNQKGSRVPSSPSGYTGSVLAVETGTRPRADSSCHVCEIILSFRCLSKGVCEPIRHESDFIQCISVPGVYPVCLRMLFSKNLRDDPTRL
ncbi:unnamed protein product, partial [Sphacelaria rigidula]